MIMQSLDTGSFETAVNDTHSTPLRSAESEHYDYDLFVIGSGPSGQRAAIQAAKLGKRVAVAEMKRVIGGTCINTGTIPSKTLREAAMHLSGYRERSVYGASYSVKRGITMGDLLYRAELVIRNEIDVTQNQLQRNNVELFNARASFITPHKLVLELSGNRGRREVSAEKIIVSVGTQAPWTDAVEFDGQRIFNSDDILGLESLPSTLAIVGAGVIGCEYASIFAMLGVRVTLIDKRSRLLPFVDYELVDTLVHHMRQNRLTLRLGEEVESVDTQEHRTGERVRITLKSGKRINAEKALYAAGRMGNTSRLNLDAAGLATDDRGLFSVNEDYQTEVPHIYAVGDVAGFPSLASTGMEQGRHAAAHAFGERVKRFPEFFPYGIYTIPEISVVGQNEVELTKSGTPYEVGRATYREIARGQIMGDVTGILKLLFDIESHRLLGVGILGEGASELVHIGQTVLSFGGTIEYFIDSVFNYPTLAECYKTAAFDGLNRLD
jgi:NAD(P) transhydrogenase